MSTLYEMGSGEGKSNVNRCDSIRFWPSN